MNTININIYRVIDAPSALTREQGLKVYEIIFPLLAEGKEIELDFENIESMITPFLNVAIGKLYEEFTSSQLSNLLKIRNIPDGSQSKFNLVIKNAKRFYTNPTEFNESLRKAMDV